MASNSLTTKQKRAIPAILAGPTIEAGCKRARVGKTTFYAWLKDDAFRQEFDRQADQIADAGFRTIAANIERAAIALVTVLDSKDMRSRRLAANDLLTHYMKQRELDELAARLDGIEEQLRGKS